MSRPRLEPNEYGDIDELFRRMDAVERRNATIITSGGGGGGAPTGPAGGDLAGTYPNPSVGAGVIFNANVNAGAAIAESKLNLATDAAPGTGSRRTLGSGANQAMPGNQVLSAIAPPSADVSMANHKLTNGADPTLAQDFATKHYVDNFVTATALTLPRVRLTKTGSMALPNTAVTLVTWDTAVDAAGAALWAAGTPGAITIPEDGWYTVTCGLWFANATGDHDLILAQYTNTGLRFAEDNGNEGEGVYRTVTVTRRFTAGFQLGIYAFQNSGAASTVGAASEQQAFLEVTKIPAVESSGVVVGPQTPAIGVRAKVGPGGGQVIASNGNGVVALNAEDFDTDNMHSTVTNTTRLVCNTAGVYEIDAWAKWNVGTGGFTYMSLQKNGVGIGPIGENSGTGGHMDISATVSLAVGDYIEIAIANNTATALTIDQAAVSAVRVPGAQGSALSVTSTLPSNPVDGQECYYLADAANGIVWHLKYRAASTSAYKWEAVGSQTPLLAVVDAANVTGISAAYADLSGGPTLTLPLAGDWLITVEANMFRVGAGYVEVSYRLSGGTTAAALDTDSVGFTAETANSGSNTPQGEGVRARRKNALAAATVVTMQGKTSDTASASARWRSLAARPIRVG